MERLQLAGFIFYVLTALFWTYFACKVQFAFYGTNKRRLLLCAILNFLFYPISLIYGALTFKKRLKEYADSDYWSGSP